MFRVQLRSRGRRALAGATVMGACAAVALAVAPAASATPGVNYSLTYQDVSGHPEGIINQGGAISGGPDQNVTMSPGTSPDESDTTSKQGQVTAFQGANHDLWTLGPNPGPAVDTGQGMLPGTSPSVVSLQNGGVEIAFQANTTNLITIGAAGNRAWNLGMMPGTSPSITTLGSGFEVAFEANTTDLWTVGNDMHGDWHLGMDSHSSPSITDTKDGHYEVAFQANSHNLWTVGGNLHGDWGLGMAAGTSPAIAHVTNQGGHYEVAFQANTGVLWTVAQDNHGPWGIQMAPGTSPSITCVPVDVSPFPCNNVNGEYVVAVHSTSANRVATAGMDGTVYSTPIAAGTSPSVAF